MGVSACLLSWGGGVVIRRGNRRFRVVIRRGNLWRRRFLLFFEEVFTCSSFGVVICVAEWQSFSLSVVFFHLILRLFSEAYGVS